MEYPISGIFGLNLDLQEESDMHVATWLNRHRITIGVHLDGHNAGSHPGIWSHTPVLRAVHYRYMSSLMASGVSHYVTDSIVVPPELSNRFGEKMMLLPGPYLPNMLRENSYGFSKVVCKRNWLSSLQFLI